MSSAASVLKGSQTGPVIVRGSAERSFLFQRVTNHTMPPAGAGEPLAGNQIEILRQWIERTIAVAPAISPREGSLPEVSEADRKFWAFQRPQKSAVPKAKNPKQIRTPVDGFVLAKLESKGLAFSPEASKLTLLRRAYLDLVGVPPSPEEIETYVADSKPAAYERMIDRLLNSPQYGERWARHWLDVAGYTDETGFASDLRGLVLNEGIWCCIKEWSLTRSEQPFTI